MLHFDYKNICEYSNVFLFCLFIHQDSYKIFWWFTKRKHIKNRSSAKNSLEKTWLTNKK